VTVYLESRRDNLSESRNKPRAVPTGSLSMAVISGNGLRRQLGPIKRGRH
jgi:hypothetical protein